MFSGQEHPTCEVDSGKDTAGASFTVASPKKHISKGTQYKSVLNKVSKFLAHGLHFKAFALHVLRILVLELYIL